MMTPRRIRDVYGYLGMVSGIGLLTLAMWPARPHLTTATFALVYLLAVFAGALRWGAGPGILGSILAVLALDYFFIPPLFTLTVDAPSDAVSLVALLVVTVVTSRLVARARAQAREAEARARESQALLAVSNAMAETPSAEDAPRAIVELAVRLFQVRSCAILLPDALGALRVQAAIPSSDGLTREEEGLAAYVWRHGALMPHGPALYVLIRMGTRRLGVLRLGARADGGPLPEGDHGLVETFAGAAAVAIDRRRLQEAATAAEVLRKSDELKTALLGAVSHDLRTPLATIKTGITALLDDSVWDREAQREVLSAANAEVDRLARLIGNLLDLSRIESGALAPDRQWYEIGEIVAETVRRAGGRPRNHPITTAIAHGEQLLYVDYVQIQQVLTNVLDNAAKYSPEGAEIHVSTAIEGDRFVIRVRDRGPGIPASEAERIFSKFYRIGRHGEGSGLGLAICRGLIEAHHGSIAVENPGAPGAVFAVTLPLSAPPALARTAAAGERP